MWVSVPATLQCLKYLLFSESAARAWRQNRDSTATPHIEQNAQVKHESKSDMKETSYPVCSLALPRVSGRGQVSLYPLLQRKPHVVSPVQVLPFHLLQLCLVVPIQKGPQFLEAGAQTRTVNNTLRESTTNSLPLNSFALPLMSGSSLPNPSLQLSSLSAEKRKKRSNQVSQVARLCAMTELA